MCSYDKAGGNARKIYLEILGRWSSALVGTRDRLFSAALTNVAGLGPIGGFEWLKSDKACYISYLDGGHLMTRTDIYRSEVAAAVHEMMAGGHHAGFIDDETMREFDESCLVPVVPAPQDATDKVR
jgi:hypothetical protein